MHPGNPPVRAEQDERVAEAKVLGSLLEEDGAYSKELNHRLARAGTIWSNLVSGATRQHRRRAATREEAEIADSGARRGRVGIVGCHRGADGVSGEGQPRAPAMAGGARPARPASQGVCAE